MERSIETHDLSNKLTVPLVRVVEKHKARIKALLASDGALQAGQILHHDESVRKVAVFCYPLLPGLLRLVIKEPTFIHFVMTNRERLLTHLVPAAM